jgi:hypothetical protein
VKRRALLITARENKAPPARELRGTDAQAVCYPTKRAAARAFIGANDHVIQEWGGLDLESSAGEFDAVNERYNLKGKRRVTTLAGAIWEALPKGKPYCLDRVDLDTLNETAPALELGAFRLPDVAAVAQLEARARDTSPRRRAPRSEDAGPGFPLTGRECETVDAKGRKLRGPCASAPAGAEPTGRVLYRPRLPSGARPRIWLDELADPVTVEDEARDLRASTRSSAREEATSFDFGRANPGGLTVSANRSTMEDVMPKRDRHGRFIKRARRAKANPRRRRRTRHARRNPMPETALLINPSRRRRRRRARANPRRRRSYRRNPFAGMKRRRRRYRRNPSVFGAGFTMAHVGGAGLYGALRNGIRRLYWQFDRTDAERQVSVAKFNKHSPFIKGALFAIGWAIRKWGRGKWSDLGEGIMLGGIADGLATITENIGLTPPELEAKKAAKELRDAALQGAGVLVSNGGLSSVLVERERQLRAAEDEELDELDPNDVFDAADDDELEDADEDELY